MKNLSGIIKPHQAAKKSFDFFAACICLLLFGISLLPLLQIARYNVPSVDDYSGAYQMHLAVENGTSLLGAAWEHMITDYQNLQGTFTAGFFGAFCPLAFHPLAYFIVPFIMIGGLTISLFYFMRQVLVRFVKAKTTSVVCVTCFLATAAIQYLPSPVEGFYWWSGAFIYTGLFSLGLLALGATVHCMAVSSKFSPVWFAVTAVLLFLTGGGNYPTALGTSILTVYLLVYVAFTQRKKLPGFILLTVASVSGLLANVLAPSNLLRLQREFEGNPYEGSIVQTINLSFRFGFQFLRQWTTFPIIALLLCSVPFMYRSLRGSQFKFRLPPIFFVFSLCAYCALFAPTAYNYGWIGPQRYMNVVFFGYLLFLFGNVYYVVGWGRRILIQGLEKSGADMQILSANFDNKWRFCVVGLIVYLTAFYIMATTHNSYVDDNISFTDHYSSSQNAMLSLKDFSAQSYYAAYRSRLELLQDPDQKDLVLEPYPTKPSVLYFDDITTDPADWRNQLIAQYYNKDSVVLKENSETTE